MSQWEMIMHKICKNICLHGRRPILELVKISIPSRTVIIFLLTDNE